jgi:signal transduction histidine kinase
MLDDVAVAREAVVERRAAAGPAIGVVEERGRQALTEMRRLLGVLRHGDEDLALAPYPSLVRLGALKRSQPGDGPLVSLRVEGTPRPVPAGLDVAAYRVVEDVLASATTAGRADVVVRWDPRDLELEVAVDGPELADLAQLGPVRERVALFSGRLQAGRRPGGGSAIRAALPVREAS